MRIASIAVDLKDSVNMALMNWYTHCYSCDCLLTIEELLTENMILILAAIATVKRTALLTTTISLPSCLLIITSWILIRKEVFLSSPFPLWLPSISVDY